MKIPFFQIDAFASKPFEGNPAAVCPLENWLSDELMQQIAMENQLSETAFFVPTDNSFELRWFTPTTEVELCGHATLASAHVLWQHLGCKSEELTFNTQSGALHVTQTGEGLCLKFPIRPLTQRVTDSAEVVKALNTDSHVTLVSSDRKLIVELANQTAVDALAPDFNALTALPFDVFYVTAPSDNYDFVCRVFAPAKGINEDPVTGSAYTSLGPYWSEKLGTKQLRARQTSARGGDVHLKLVDDKILITGKTVTVITGELHLPSPANL